MVNDDHRSKELRPNLPLCTCLIFQKSDKVAPFSREDDISIRPKSKCVNKIVYLQKNESSSTSGKRASLTKVRKIN